MKCEETLEVKRENNATTLLCYQHLQTIRVRVRGFLSIACREQTTASRLFKTSELNPWPVDPWPTNTAKALTDTCRRLVSSIPGPHRHRIYDRREELFPTIEDPVAMRAWSRSRLRRLAGQVCHADDMVELTSDQAEIGRFSFLLARTQSIKVFRVITSHSR